MPSSAATAQVIMQGLTILAALGFIVFVLATGVSDWWTILGIVLIIATAVLG